MSDAVRHLIDACLAVVNMGHIRTDEGFEDCPAPVLTGTMAAPTVTVDLERCDCHVRPALEALQRAIEEGLFEPEDGWDERASGQSCRPGKGGVRPRDGCSGRACGARRPDGHARRDVTRPCQPLGNP